MADESSRAFTIFMLEEVPSVVACLPLSLLLVFSFRATCKCSTDFADGVPADTIGVIVDVFGGPSFLSLHIFYC